MVGITEKLKLALASLDKNIADIKKSQEPLRKRTEDIRVLAEKREKILSILHERKVQKKEFEDV